MQNKLKMYLNYGFLVANLNQSTYADTDIKTNKKWEGLKQIFRCRLMSFKITEEFSDCI